MSEFISIAGDNPLTATIHSTLLSDMETTVKLKLGEDIFTSDVSSGVGFPVDANACLAFKGSDMLLFDNATRSLIAVNKL